MKTTETQVVLRKLTPSKGMVITDVATETMRSTEVYLGKDDSSDNYKEIPADTPLPQSDNNDGTAVPA